MGASRLSSDHQVSTAAELVSAIRDSVGRRIVVRGVIENAPSMRLAPGQILCGADASSSITFADGVDGLQLSTDNEVSGLQLTASPHKRAIFNDTTVASLGRMRLADVSVTRQVQLLARDTVKSGHVDVDGLDIVSADARACADRPVGFGVHVLQGAFTLWNMQADERVTISANLVGLAAGREGAPSRRRDVWRHRRFARQGRGDEAGGHRLQRQAGRFGAIGRDRRRPHHARRGRVRIRAARSHWRVPGRRRVCSFGRRVRQDLRRVAAWRIAPADIILNFVRRCIDFAARRSASARDNTPPAVGACHTARLPSLPIATAALHPRYNRETRMTKGRDIAARPSGTNYGGVDGRARQVPCSPGEQPSGQGRVTRCDSRLKRPDCSPFGSPRASIDLAAHRALLQVVSIRQASEAISAYTPNRSGTLM